MEEIIANVMYGLSPDEQRILGANGDSMSIEDAKIPERYEELLQKKQTASGEELAVLDADEQIMLGIINEAWPYIKDNIQISNGYHGASGSALN